MSSLAFDFMQPQVWRHVPVEDPISRELADRHYSRQTIGADGILAPGERFLLRHDGEIGRAIWGVVHNYFRDAWRLRNVIFRNESSTLSSELIKAATITTADLWLRRYHMLPEAPLVTEVDVEKTRRRRSKKAPPGVCYLYAGWQFIGIFDPKHGRSVKAIYKAPLPWSQKACSLELLSAA
jgi:hypothetical protein